MYGPLLYQIMQIQQTVMMVHCILYYVMLFVIVPDHVRYSSYAIQCQEPGEPFFHNLLNSIKPFILLFIEDIPHCNDTILLIAELVLKFQSHDPMIIFVIVVLTHLWLQKMREHLSFGTLQMLRMAFNSFIHLNTMVFISVCNNVMIGL